MARRSLLLPIALAAGVPLAVGRQPAREDTAADEVVKPAPAPAPRPIPRAPTGPRFEAKLVIRGDARRPPPAWPAPSPTRKTAAPACPGRCVELLAGRLGPAPPVRTAEARACPHGAPRLDPTVLAGGGGSHAGPPMAPARCPR